MTDSTSSDHPMLPFDGMPDPAVTARAQEQGLSYDRIIDIFLTGYADRPALAERVYEIRKSPSSGESAREFQTKFRAISYRTLRERVAALSMAWRNDPELFVHRGELVGIIGFASVDYAVIDLALAYSKAVPVPLSNHHTPAEFQEAFQTTQPAALAVSIAHLPDLLDLVARQECIRSLIVFDYDPRVSSEKRMIDEAGQKLRAAGSRTLLLPLQDLIGRGSSDDFAFLPSSTEESEELTLLMHTSGSTGQPKGACIAAKALMNTWRNVLEPFPKVVVILAPFHHMMGRDSMVSALNSGGTAYFTQRPDLSTVFEDIRLVRPTALVLFPRICEWIYQHFQSPETTTAKASRAARSFLGDRLEFIVVASAPLAPNIKKFIEETFQVPVHEGYSSTETASGGLAMNGFLNRNNILEYRLRDVPESGYFTTDRPYPRGELCVKTRFGIKEYFQNPEATTELFDADGFSCTGDIVEERGENQIAIIDRRKNVIKLSQGEFVAVGKLGQLFEEGSPILRQCFVHGDSGRSYLLAVVVPDHEALGRMAPPPATREDLPGLLRAEILRIAREQKLRSFEIPRDFVIAEEPFSQRNGLLSSVGKPIRPAIRNRFREALEQLYEKHEANRLAELESLRQSETERSIEDRLRILLSSTLGVSCPEDAQFTNFRELGGDSLAAVQLAVAIEKEFGVSIDGSQILSPRGTMQELARWIRNEKGSPSARPQDHGSFFPDADAKLHARNFRLEHFVGNEIASTAARLPHSPHPPQTVLLTGANGFLGGRVCLAWLEKLSKVGGRLICLVRPSASQSARERLDARFERHDAATRAHYRKLADSHLEVVSADISEHGLGLDPNTYERLSMEVDAICHCAALVNHRLSYQHVFLPNVQGTGEILRLALTHKRKSIDFVSTIGVCSLEKNCSTRGESNVGLESILLDASYAVGYFASKWACEQLLRSAHEETNLPIRIIRPGLILPDRNLVGERNPDDILCRLMHSILSTRIAPESFVPENPEIDREGFGATGLPVDLLADAILAMGDFAPKGFHLFQLGSGEDAMFPLDSLMDCLEGSGFPLERISSYQAWLARMERELRHLPADQKSQTMLDVLDAFATQPPPNSALASDAAFQRFLLACSSGDSRPVFSKEYLCKCLRDFGARAVMK